MSDVKEFFEQIIKSNKVVLFMKGNTVSPQCGFSAQVVAILRLYDVDYAEVNVMNHESYGDIRADLKEYSNWPTFPQLYCNGELIGGCDIITELHENEELEELLK